MDFEKLSERYASYWNRENEDRPIVYMTTSAYRIPVEKDNAHPTFRDAWMDTEYVIRKSRQSIEASIYLGEGYPALNPNLGPDLVGAVCGCELEFGAITSWSKPCIEDYESFGDIKFNETTCTGKRSVKLRKRHWRTRKGTMS